MSAVQLRACALCFRTDRLDVPVFDGNVDEPGVGQLDTSAESGRELVRSLLRRPQSQEHVGDSFGKVGGIIDRLSSSLDWLCTRKNSSRSDVEWRRKLAASRME